MHQLHPEVSLEGIDDALRLTFFETSGATLIQTPSGRSAVFGPGQDGRALTADLGTITRPDGTKQVTYKGHPLYYFSKDKDDGDSYGEGLKTFGSDWYVLAPSGKKVDNS